MNQAPKAKCAIRPRAEIKIAAAPVVLIGINA